MAKFKRITDLCWRNFDPWECCGQDNFCERGSHNEGGCVNGCIVPKIYSRLAAYEDTGLSPEQVAEMAKTGTQTWVSPKDRLPEEHDSIFAKYYGTQQWNMNMFRKTSNAVLISIRDMDGNAAVVTAYTKDGNWRADILRIKPYEITHWMPFPKPATEG